MIRTRANLALTMLALAGMVPTVSKASHDSANRFERLVGLEEVERALRLAETMTEPNLDAAEAILKQQRAKADEAGLRFAQSLSVIEARSESWKVFQATEKAVQLRLQQSLAYLTPSDISLPKPRRERLSKNEAKAKAKRKAAKAARKASR